MSITQKDNRVTIACSIPEAEAAYAWVRENGFQAFLHVLENRQLVITARPAEGEKEPA